MGRRLAISASVPTRIDASGSPKSGTPDTGESLTKSHKKRRGATKVDFKQPEQTTQTTPIAKKRGVVGGSEKQLTGEGKSTDSESNSNTPTPKIPSRRYNRAPRLQPGAQSRSHLSNFESGKVPSWAQQPVVPYSGVDAGLYAQYFAGRNFVEPFTSASGGYPQNGPPHFPPTDQAYSTYGSPEFGFSHG
jgi:hypothetical protein